MRTTRGAHERHAESLGILAGLERRAAGWMREAS
jgi:hypothetical protein